MSTASIQLRQHAMIESLLTSYRDTLGRQFIPYRHHVYRVFYHCLMLDRRPELVERYAIAAVFHDLGIWTDHTIDYLNPSKRLAAAYLDNNGRAEWVDQILSMIEWHHKVGTYEGRYRRSVETFRKADWADVSLGLVAPGLSGRLIRACRRRFPTKGFHRFLLGRIIRNFLRHPLRPLPMFRL